MECLPPVGWNDVARRHDVDLLRGDMAALEVRLRSELQTGLADMRAEMHQGFNRILVWLVSTILGAVGAVLGLIAYVG